MLALVWSLLPVIYLPLAAYVCCRKETKTKPTSKTKPNVIWTATTSIASNRNPSSSGSSVKREAAKVALPAAVKPSPKTVPVLEKKVVGIKSKETSRVEEKKSAKEQKKSQAKEAPRPEQKLGDYPRVTLPTESAKEKKMMQLEESKKAKIASGYYQSKSDEDDTLEAVESLKMEASLDKTGRRLDEERMERLLVELDHDTTRYDAADTVETQETGSTAGSKKNRSPINE